MKTRIVYLDDEAELLSIFREILENDDIQVETFSDPALAIQKINDTKPDLVFLDYRLPTPQGTRSPLPSPQMFRRFC